MESRRRCGGALARGRGRLAQGKGWSRQVWDKLFAAARRLFDKADG